MVATENPRKRKGTGLSSYKDTQQNAQGTQSETTRSLVWGEILSQSESQNTRFLTEAGQGTQSNMNRMVINKNDSIKKRLSKILKLLQERMKEPEIEILLIASGQSIQKLVTIVEIVKQKIGVQVSEKSKMDKVERNRRNAKIDGMQKVVVGDKEVRNLRFRFDQFNYLDYSLMSESEFRQQRRKRAKGKTEITGSKTGRNQTVTENGGYTRRELDALKIQKDVKIPVFYSYLNFRPENQDAEISSELKDKFTGLVEEGWSRQRE